MTKHQCFNCHQQVKNGGLFCLKCLRGGQEKPSKKETVEEFMERNGLGDEDMVNDLHYPEER